MLTRTLAHQRPGEQFGTGKIVQFTPMVIPFRCQCRTPSNHAVARDLLHEGHDVARQLGYDGNECFTAFGPTNVYLHQVAVLLDLGDGAGAVQAAQHITPEGLNRLPKERRANYYLALREDTVSPVTPTMPYTCVRAECGHTTGDGRHRAVRPRCLRAWATWDRRAVLRLGADVGGVGGEEGDAPITLNSVSAQLIKLPLQHPHEHHPRSRKDPPVEPHCNRRGRHCLRRSRY